MNLGTCCVVEYTWSGYCNFEACSAIACVGSFEACLALVSYFDDGTL